MSVPIAATGRARTALAAFAVALLLSGCATGTAETATADKAKTTIDKMVEPSLLMAARAAEADHDYFTAAKHYRNLYARNPDDRTLMLQYVRALRYAGMPDQSIEVISQHLDSDGDAELLLELGKAYLAADRVELAIRFLREARSRDAENWQVHSALGVAYDYIDDFAQAQENYVIALTLSPNNATVLNNLALSQAQAGDIDGAINSLRQANLQPEATAQMRQNLALLLALKGDLEGAKRLAYKDLPQDAIRHNVAYYKLLSENRKLD